ncbi:hypothetical protein PF004_g28604 [Phytophthora fragariae]|uniref:HTH CENPB-type domain-containing protein n=2 Tax=Phytophthora fragariae TaxID=53985 RepID=A0A6G0MIH9_9STRA|nr:hypothetical protein PF004_g28604 [Phytophthora fragariae]
MPKTRPKKNWKKHKAVEAAKAPGVSQELAATFGVHRATLWRWVRAEEAIAAAAKTIPSKTYVSRGTRGVKPRYPEMDTRLLQWVIEMRKNKSRCVTTECLFIMAARYEPDFRVGRTRQAAIMYLHRFRRRNRLSVRRITHRGTKQREEMEKIADEFSNTIQYYVEESGTVAHLNGLDKFSCVYNMDQTAVYIDMNPSTTIDFAGARHVDVVQVQKKAYCDEVRMLQWIEEVSYHEVIQLI